MIMARWIVVVLIVGAAWSLLGWLIALTLLLLLLLAIGLSRLSLSAGRAIVGRGWRT